MDIRGKKCDHCGAEKREMVHPSEANMIAMTPLATEPSWMRIEWGHTRDLCPSCAEIANAAIGFARDIRK